jgi:hypothetical protein
MVFSFFILHPISQIPFQKMCREGNKRQRGEKIGAQMSQTTPHAITQCMGRMGRAGTQARHGVGLR